MRPRSREKSVRVRLFPGELVWFHQLARQQELTLSELVRQSLAAEAVRLGVEQPATTA